MEILNTLTIFFVSLLVWADARNGTHTIQKRATVLNKKVWPNSTVPYELDSSLLPEHYRIVHQTFEEFERRTCLSFQPHEKERGFMKIYYNPDLSGGGGAGPCYIAEQQRVTIGNGWFFVQILTHEIGHLLCLPHEHHHNERDDFMEYSNCHEDDIPPKFDKHEFFKNHRGHLYDITSQMHRTCGQGCAGLPKQEAQGGCGSQVNEGLSVLDADTINDFYSCKDCLRHRWKRLNALTDDDKDNLLQFGSSDDEPTYLCRTFVGDEIAPGKWVPSKETCYVGFEGKEWPNGDKHKRFVQLLVVRSGGPKYRALSVSFKNQPRYIRVGRTGCSIAIYAAISKITVDERTEVAVGKVYENDLTVGFFSLGREVVRRKDYEILGCK